MSMWIRLRCDRAVTFGPRGRRGRWSRSKPQSRAGSLPPSSCRAARRRSAAGCHHCPTEPEPVAAHCLPLLSGSEDPSHKIPAPPRIERHPCGSDLGRDTAVVGRRFRSRPQSRASSLPQRLIQRHALPPPLSGSEGSSHKILAPTPDRAPSLWERPWPRRGRRGPPASMHAAVGVRRPLPQNHRPGAGRGCGSVPVGAALAATRRCRAAGFDAGRRRGQKTPPTKSPLRQNARPSLQRWPFSVLIRAPPLPNAHESRPDPRCPQPRPFPHRCPGFKNKTGFACR